MENNEAERIHDALSPSTEDEPFGQNEMPTLPLKQTIDTEQEGLSSKANRYDSSVIGLELIESVRKLIAEMQSLKRDFDTKVKYDESKERQVDSLHRELQTYREGLHFRILRPLFIDLIAVHDDFGKFIESIPNEESSGIAGQFIKNLSSFQETIEEILRRNGVEAFYTDGTQFVSSKQRALQAIETSDATLDRQVARRVRKGFECEGRLLRPELVVIYKAVSNK